MISEYSLNKMQLQSGILGQLLSQGQSQVYQIFIKRSHFQVQWFFSKGSKMTAFNEKLKLQFSEKASFYIWAANCKKQQHILYEEILWGLMFTQCNSFPLTAETLPPNVPTCKILSLNILPKNILIWHIKVCFCKI